MEQCAIPSRVTVPDGEGGIIHRRFVDCVLHGRDSDLHAHYEHVRNAHHLEAVKTATNDFHSNMVRIRRSAGKLNVATGREWLAALEAGRRESVSTTQLSLRTIANWATSPRKSSNEWVSQLPPGHRKDLFGCIDILAIGEGNTVAIQCTTDGE